MYPTVSIIIPCFNASKTVTAAVQSALNQTYGAIEVLLVDDGSTDKTADVVRMLSLSDTRIRPIYLHQNLGPSAARNAAIKQAKGQWIVLLDADDLYEPHRVEALLDVALSTGAELVADNIIIEDYLSGRTRTLGFSFNGVTEPISFDLSSFMASTTRAGGGLNLGHLKPLIKCSFLIEHKLEFATKYRVGEDFLLFAECLQKRGRLLVLPQPGYIYRRRADSITRSVGENYRILANMNRELMLRWRQQLSDDELQVLETRQRVLDKDAKWESFRAAVGSGAVFRAVGGIIHSPSVIGEVMRRLWLRVRRLLLLDL